MNYFSMRSFAEFVLAHPRIILLGMALLVLTAVYPALQVRTDFNLEGFYPADDPVVTNYQNVTEEFGRDDNVIMVGFKDDSLLTSKTLRTLKVITDSVKAIPNVEDVQSLWSATEITNKNNTLSFEPYLGQPISDSEKSLRALRKSLLEDPFVNGLLIDSTASTTAFYISIDGDKNSYSVRNAIIQNLNTILDKYPEFDFKITGISYFRNQYVNLLNQEIVFYIALSSALIIMLLWYLYRSKMGLFMPMLIVWMTLLFTVATLYLTGGYFEIMSSTIAPILLCVGVADSIHMISKFDDAVSQGFEKRNAIIETLITLGSATFLTSITTAIGFATLLSSSVIPMKRFGIYTAAGVLIAYLITILFLPAILKITNTKRVFKKEGGKLYTYLGQALLKLAAFNRRKYKTIVVSGLILTALIGMGITTLDVNGYVFDDVGRDSRLIKDSRFFGQELSPVFPIEFIVDTGTKNGITNPETLKKIKEFEEYLLSFEEIQRTTSFATLVSEIHKVMAPEDASHSAIPDNENLISQYLLLLEINDNGILENVTDFSYQKIRVAGQTEDAGSKRINAIRDSVQTYLSTNFPKSQTTITGSTVLSADLVGKIVYSLASSIGLAFIGISIVMAMLFRDVKMVAISLIPNILPLILIAGFMGIFGIDIKPSTAVIFTIAFGIAVDDTIHYLARFRIEVKRGMNLEDALQVTTQKTGRAIIITSLILLCGFGTLISSEFVSTTLMGILVSSTIFFAVLADLVLLPALFYWLNPQFDHLQETSKHDPQFAGEVPRELESHR